MIPRALFLTLLAALFGWTSATVTAAPMTIGEWLYAATGLNQQSSSGFAMSKPDYLAGKTKAKMCGVISRFGPSGNAGTWEVLAYDRTHHLGLAASSTDACNVALFSAPPPPKPVRSADLSAYQTTRGIRVGSSYSQVVAAYGGGKPKHGSHFIATFSAPVPPEKSYDEKRLVKLSEDILIKVDNSRVSSIAILIDLGGLS